MIFSVILLAGCEPKPDPAISKVSTNQQRIGIYDSRSIAVAYVNSPAYRKYVQPVMDRKHLAYSKAQKEGNTPAIEELKAWGQAQQTRLHMQAFSTESVDEILKQIADRLPMIKQQVGVSRLVSKWDQEALDNINATQQVDVTMLLIDALEPTVTQRKSAIEIQQHKPISLKKARQIDD